MRVSLALVLALAVGCTRTQYRVNSATNQRVPDPTCGSRKLVPTERCETGTEVPLPLVLIGVPMALLFTIAIVARGGGESGARTAP